MSSLDTQNPVVDIENNLVLPAIFENLIAMLLKPTTEDRLVVLSYTPDEQLKYIKQNTSSRNRLCCENHILIGDYEWIDDNTKMHFCDQCSLKYGWRKETPIDLLNNNIGRCFIVIKERNIRFSNYSFQDKVFDQASVFITKKDYFSDLFNLFNKVRNSEKEPALIQWVDEFKLKHQNLFEIENDPCTTFIIMNLLLLKFPLDLHLDKEILQEISDQKQETKPKKERFSPYQLNKSSKSSKSSKMIPNPEYIKIKDILDNMYKICIKAIEIHCTKWDNNPENYLKIINEVFPL